METQHVTSNSSGEEMKDEGLLVSILETYTVEKLGKPCEHIFSINNDSTVAQALHLLNQHNILSAPILDKEKSQYIGFVDMVDVVSYTVDLFEESQLLNDDFHSLLEQEEKFQNENVLSVADYSQRNPFVPVRGGAKLVDVLRVLGNYHVHRVPIIDENGRILNIVTQSKVVSFLAQNVDKLGVVVDKAVRDVLPEGRGVVSVRMDDKALVAFRLMAKNRVSAVAVVDNQGTLLATISVRDIRVVAGNARSFNRFNLSIREFLIASNLDRIDIINPSISCKLEDTLRQVLLKLATSRVHRVFVVNQQSQPIGVLSLGDVLSALVK